MKRFMRYLIPLLVMAPWCNLTVRAADPTAEEAVELLTKRRRGNQPNPEVEAVLNRATSQPAFHSELVAVLVERLTLTEKPHAGAREIRILRELKAVEALPVLLERWKNTPKKTHLLARADPRVQLVETIAALQKNATRREFLIKAMDDEQEALKVRLHAHVALCATGDPIAIEHVTAAYEKEIKRFSRTLNADKYPPWTPPVQEWDSDGDWLADHAERGLLLDPANKDTDGDGLPDGNDRNPLTVPAGELTEHQQVAQYLLHMYAKYLAYPNRNAYGPRRAMGPSPFVYIVATTNRGWDSSDTPSVFSGLEIQGVAGTVLSMDIDGRKRYSNVHGPNSTPFVSAICLSDLESEQHRTAFLRNEEIEPGTKVWQFSESKSNGGVRNGKMFGNARVWSVHVKKFGDIWLPIRWELRMIT